MSRRQCHGLTRTGNACGAQPSKGSDYCWQHAPEEMEPSGAAANAANTSGAHAPRGRATWDRAEFLSALEYTGMVTEACKMVGIGRTTAYEERERNPEFAAQWAEVDAAVVERLEKEAYRRAHDGVAKKVVSAGQEFGTEQVYSDGLLQFLLKAKRPEVYRERVDVAHSGSTSVQVTRRVDLSKLSDAQLDALDSIEDALKGDGGGV